MSRSGVTALHVAAANGNADVAAALIEAGGADPGAVCDDGMLPLNCAVEGGHDEVARVLICSAGDGARDAVNHRPAGGTGGKLAPLARVLVNERERERQLTATTGDAAATAYRMVCTLLAHGADAASARAAARPRGPDDDSNPHLYGVVGSWLDGTHPLRAERLAVEGAVLGALCRKVPVELALLCGQFVHLE